MEQISALFKDLKTAHTGLDKLIDNGIPRESITIVNFEEKSSGEGIHQDELEQDKAERSLLGGGLGALLGTLCGVAGAVILSGAAFMFPFAQMAMLLAGAFIGYWAGSLLGVHSSLADQHKSFGIPRELVKSETILISVDTSFGTLAQSREIIRSSLTKSGGELYSLTQGAKKVSSG